MDKQVLGSNLRRFMKLSPDANTIKLLSIKSTVSTASISNILNGKTNPTADILEKLSQALSKSIDALLKPMPILKTLRFRTNKQMTAREKAQRDSFLCDASEWMNAYSSFDRIQKMKNLFPKILELSKSDPIHTANEVRNIWNIDDNLPIYNLENYITNSGIKLLGMPFGFKQTFGISVGKDDGGPAIIVNTDQTISGERRIFTLAHELGHIILHKDSYGKNNGKIESKDNPEEKEANLFASHLLMPQASFEKMLENSKKLGLVETILKIKRYYRVSYKTVLYRINEMSKFSNIELNKNFAYLFNQKYHHSLQNHYEPFSLGEIEFTNTSAKANVFSAVAENKISLELAGMLLGIENKNLINEYNFWKEELICTKNFFSF